MKMSGPVTSLLSIGLVGGALALQAPAFAQDSPEPTSGATQQLVSQVLTLKQLNRLALTQAQLREIIQRLSTLSHAEELFASHQVDAARPVLEPLRKIRTAMQDGNAPDPADQGQVDAALAGLRTEQVHVEKLRLETIAAIRQILTSTQLNALRSSMGLDNLGPARAGGWANGGVRVLMTPGGEGAAGAPPEIKGRRYEALPDAPGAPPAPEPVPFVDPQPVPPAGALSPAAGAPGTALPPATPPADETTPAPAPRRAADLQDAGVRTTLEEIKAIELQAMQQVAAAQTRLTANADPTVYTGIGEPQQDVPVAVTVGTGAAPTAAAGPQELEARMARLEAQMAKLEAVLNRAFADRQRQTYVGVPQKPMGAVPMPWGPYYPPGDVVGMAPPTAVIQQGAVPNGYQYLIASSPSVDIDDDIIARFFLQPDMLRYLKSRAAR